LSDTTSGVPAQAISKKAGAAHHLQDPIGLLLRLLESGVAPEACWPGKTEGLAEVIHTNSGPPVPGSRAAHRLEAAIGGSPVSAIQVHRAEKALLAAARRAICHFGWLFEPGLAVLVVANPEEQERYQAQLLRWWQDEFIPSGMDPSAAPSVVLHDRLGRRQWQEVVLSPGCLALRGVDLANAVAAASLALHVMPMPR
jgi:hypothetical protein